MTSLPPWLASEKNVTELFVNFGFDVQHVSVGGRQIDLVATRSEILAIAPETWLVEITDEKVGAQKGAADAQKLRRAAKEFQHARMMIVSTRGFTDDQKESLEQADGIICRTYQELESRALNLLRYATSTKAKYSNATEMDIGLDPTVFVEPRLELHRDVNDADVSETLDGSSWIEGIVRLPSGTGVVGALLGNLGSGKTTLLQRTQLAAIERFLEAPSLEPLPIYIPLGRYKHHSGHVDSMLREVLANAGIATYPTDLIRTLARHGRICFLFDGLDEVHPIHNTDDVIATVTNLLDYVGREARAIISSRTHMFATSTDEFAIFGPYERKELSKLGNHLRTLLAGGATTEIAYVRPFTDDQVSQYLRATCGNLFGEIRASIDTMYGFKEMATTPVLLAMMRHTLPDMIRRGTGFGPIPQLELYQAYTDRWINRDFGRAQLLPEQRKRLSKMLAKHLITQDEFSARWGEIQQILEADPFWAEKPISNEDAGRDVRNSTFLIREGSDHFRFIHRSIMEYFAAIYSLEGLQAGEPVQTPFSDGHATFLRMLLAQAWLGSPRRNPLPVRELDLDSWAGSEYLALIADASCRLPTHTEVETGVIKAKGELLRPLRFANVTVSDLTLDVERIEDLVFENCTLLRCHISVSGRANILFKNCTMVRSTLTLSQESWGRLRFAPIDDLIAPSLNMDKAFEMAARWVDHDGCNAEVGKHRWTVKSRALRLAAACGRRVLSKSRISIENFATGKLANELDQVLPALLRSGILAEDTSRQPHQLSLGSTGTTLFVGLRKNPLEHQATLAVFDE